MTYHLTLLGGTLLQDETGAAVPVASRRHPLALLALLATAPGYALSRGKLAGLLWPESTEKAARHRLNTCLYHVRKGLGDAAVSSLGDDVSLDPDALDIDVVRFQAALERGDREAAVLLYGGPFLDGFRLGGSPGFEHRVDQLRSGLRQHFVGALEVLAEEAEEAGDHRATARWWEERVRQDPLDSRVVLRLMQARMAGGNVAGAIDAAERHAVLLREEIGVAPAPPVQALVRRLKAREETGGPARPGTPDTTTPPPAISTTAPSGPPAPDEDGRPPVPPAPSRRRSRVFPLVPLGAAALLALIAGVGGAWFLEERAAPAPTGRDRIAVLPFRTPGEEPSAFAEGVYWEVLTHVSRIRGFDVISPTSVEQLGTVGEGPRSLQRIAERLGVEWVVRGDVQEVGDAVQVHVRLMDARRDRQVWADRYVRERTSENLLGLQREVTERIAAALESELISTARGEGWPRWADLEAHLAYVQGRSQMAELTEDGIRRAEAHFRRAIQIDSSYALPWLGMASAAYKRRAFGYATDEGMEPHRALDRALALDPSLPEARAIRGQFQLPGAPGLRELQAAAAGRPNDAEVQHWLGHRLRQMGELEASVRHLERAARLDPLSPGIAATLAGSYYFAGRMEDALAHSRRAQALAPDWAEGRMGEGLLLTEMGRHREAVDLLLRDVLTELEPESRWRVVAESYLAVAQARAGDTVAARRGLQALPDLPAVPVLRAMIQIALADEEGALRSFTQGRPRGFEISLLRYAPALAHLRDTPAARDVLERFAAPAGPEGGPLSRR